MTRLQKLDSLYSHSWYKRLLARLNEKELAYLKTLIEENDHLDRAAFYLKISRLCMREDRPKRWAIIEEIASVCNDPSD